MRVVPALDVAEDVPPGVAAVVEGRAVDEFAFEAGEEALGHGVVEAVTGLSHGGQYAGFAAALAAGQGGVLAVSIGVVDDSPRSSLVEGHLQRAKDQVGAQVGGHRPARDSAAEGIEHDRQIQEGLSGLYVGDVRQPQAVRSIGREPAVDQVRRRAGPGRGAWCAAPCVG